MNKAKLDNYRKVLNEEFALIGKKHGLVLDFKNITYDDKSFRFTLNCTEDSPEAKKLIREDNILALQTRMRYEMGTTGDILLKLKEIYSLDLVSPTEPTQHYKFVEFNRDSEKYPVVLEKVGANKRVGWATSHLKTAVINLMAQEATA